VMEPHATSIASKIADGRVSTVDSAHLFCALCKGLKRGAVCIDET
jgi:hypothetical protein